MLTTCHFLNFLTFSLTFLSDSGSREIKIGLRYRLLIRAFSCCILVHMSSKSRINALWRSMILSMSASAPYDMSAIGLILLLIRIPFFVSLADTIYRIGHGANFFFSHIQNVIIRKIRQFEWVTNRSWHFHPICLFCFHCLVSFLSHTT